MHSNLEHLRVRHSTPVGDELLANNEVLQTAMGLFAAAQEPHKAHVPGSRLLGAGEFGFTFEIGGIAVKISSPTSSQKSFDLGRPLPPEDLRKQFLTLAALREHLQGKEEGIVTPEQYFVATTPYKAFILAQEYMNGWVSYEDRTSQVFGPAVETNATDRQEIAQVSAGIRQRIFRALGGFALINNINDLALHKESGVHGGNLLVPETANFDTNMPLCIIDQPAP